ncbi:MAG: preprotein translocase subunit YajC [Deltaproteobacteria bacterium]|nr:preprotein translocase subunit YajC [Deltaproteobacteria bacterium]
MLTLAYALGTPAGGASGSSSFMSFIPLIFMFAIFYFLLIRPQQKKAKEHKALLETLKKGDQIVTAGGIHGKVTAIDDGVVVIEIATGVNIRINKGYIATVTKQS